MEIKISSIGDKGDFSNERIGFKALKNCQLKYFLVVKSRKSENGFKNKSDATFWFLPREVKKNDRIVLYTKEGENSIKEDDDGTKTHFFYWGLKAPIFNNEEDLIVLVNVNTWKLN